METAKKCFIMRFHFSFLEFCRKRLQCFFLLVVVLSLFLLLMLLLLLLLLLPLQLLLLLLLMLFLLLLFSTFASYQCRLLSSSVIIIPATE